MNINEFAFRCYGHAKVTHSVLKLTLIRRFLIERFAHAYIFLLKRFGVIFFRDKRFLFRSHRSYYFSCTSSSRDDTSCANIGSANPRVAITYNSREFSPSYAKPLLHSTASQASVSQPRNISKFLATLRRAASRVTFARITVIEKLLSQLVGKSAISSVIKCGR